MPDLINLSAAVLAFSLIMYVLLDGTDLGVGMLFAWFPEGRDRYHLSATILPVWDANETWLVLMAGGLLALFPAAYAQLLTGLYLPLFAMLLALVARAVALEYRSQASTRMQRRLDVLFIIGSVLASFLQGALAGSILSGISFGSPFSWLTPFTVLSGIATMAAYLLAGCCWIRWRVEGEVAERCSQLASLFLVLMIVLVIGLCLLLPGRFLLAWQTPLGKALLLLSGLLIMAIPLLLRREKLILPLLAVLLLLVCLSGLALVAIYPWLIPDVLSLEEAAALPATQHFVLVGLGLVIPLTLIYNSWAFWVLRGRMK
ncbi:cytochrome d ubiquinol oxidase subunit II [Erwinia sp. P6884]|uniref:cytochrome d ubiquinol oxidase subunit II n=1 Tax=Erwinia sp. P6884 TaxID=3141450 RepID=UPI0031938F75